MRAGASGSGSRRLRGPGLRADPRHGAGHGLRVPRRGAAAAVVAGVPRRHRLRPSRPCSSPRTAEPGPPTCRASRRRGWTPWARWCARRWCSTGRAATRRRACVVAAVAAWLDDVAGGPRCPGAAPRCAGRAFPAADVQRWLGRREPARRPLPPRRSAIAARARSRRFRSRPPAQTSRAAGSAPSALGGRPPGLHRSRLALVGGAPGPRAAAQPPRRPGRRGRAARPDVPRRRARRRRGPSRRDPRCGGDAKKAPAPAGPRGPRRRAPRRRRGRGGGAELAAAIRCWPCW